MRKTVAIAIPVFTIAMLCAAAIFSALALEPAHPLLWVPLSLSATVMGSLLWYRQAGGALGILFIVTGLPVGELLQDYADAAFLHLYPGARWAAAGFQGTIGLATLFFVVMQLFPTGRPVSPRWRPLLWVSLADTAMLIAIPLLGSIDLFRTNFPGVAHPVGLLSPSVAAGLNGLAQFVGFLVYIGSAAALVVRYRRSRGDERAQMKWFTAAGVVNVVGLVIGAVLIPSGPAVVFALLSPLLALAAGLAILKYRLYDIDLVISKALVFAVLAVSITAVYVVIVVGVGTISGSGSNHLLSIAATAIVAVLFQPIRERAQRLANRLVYGERATPYEVMAGFSARVADTVSTEQVLPQMAEAAGRGVGATSATVRVHLPDGSDRVERWAAETDQSLVGEPWTVRITYQGEVVGDVNVRKPVNDPLTPAEEDLLEDLGAQAGLALHNVRLTEELAIRLRELDVQAAALRVSRERLVTARDAQRRGLQRDIQEGPERQLLDIGRKLTGVTEAEQLDPLIDGANDTLDELRNLARGIFPPLLAEQGVAAALEAHVRKVGAHATVELAPGVEGRRFDADVEACAYFCCLQAIQNVLRHAANAPTRVRLSLEDGDLAFEIADDGPGFDVAATPRGMGLQIIQDRVDALEGSLSVTSTQSGTTVAVTIPTSTHDLAGATR